MHYEVILLLRGDNSISHIYGSKREAEERSYSIVNGKLVITWTHPIRIRL